MTVVVVVGAWEAAAVVEVGGAVVAELTEGPVSVPFVFPEARRVAAASGRVVVVVQSSGFVAGVAPRDVVRWRKPEKPA